jgi:hypothetical protein
MEVLLDLVPPDLAEYVWSGGATVGTVDAARCIGAALRAAPGFSRAVAELTDPAAGPDHGHAGPNSAQRNVSTVTAVVHSCGSVLWIHRPRIHQPFVFHPSRVG